MAEQKTKRDSRTSTLLRKLTSTHDLEKFIIRNATEMKVPPFHVYLTSLCRNTGQVPEQVIKRAGIERTYGHQLFNGTRRPSRDKVMQFAFGLGLDLNGAQKLLQIAQKSQLYPRIKRDAVIVYCINHQKDIFETQSILQSLDLTLLGGE
jgi:hypothetical protein